MAIRIYFVQSKALFFFAMVLYKRAGWCLLFSLDKHFALPLVVREPHAHAIYFGCLSSFLTDHPKEV